MNYEMIDKRILEKIKEQLHSDAPLVHYITHPIVINQCANLILASGARPIMAEHPAESGDITGEAKALALNMGNINENRMKAMTVSFVTALNNDIPVVIDLAGIGISKLRRTFLSKLLDVYREKKENRGFAGRLILKGNGAEIYMLYAMYFDNNYKDTNLSNGVDAQGEHKVSESNYKKYVNMGREIFQRLETVICTTGIYDVITGSSGAFVQKNGNEMMGRITGTGCMSTALVGSFISVEEVPCDVACAAAMSYFNLCGDIAAEDEQMRPMFFLNNMIDEIYSWNLDYLEDKIKTELI